MGNKKLQVWLPLLFAIIMIAGMFVGSQLQEPFKPAKHSSLQEALDLIKLNYVDSVHIDSLQGDAIEEIMSKLDPHSCPCVPGARLERRAHPTVFLERGVVPSREPVRCKPMLTRMWRGGAEDYGRKFQSVKFRLRSARSPRKRGAQ